MLNLTADDVASLDRVRSVLADEAERGTNLSGIWQSWGSTLAQLNPSSADALSVLLAA